MDMNTEAMGFVATARPGEALHFYDEILGLDLLEDTPFAIVFQTGGRMLRVQKLPAVSPAPNTVLGWKVADIHAEIASLMAKGVEFSRYPGMEQDEAGVWTSPPGHKIAWFADPDGNNLSLTQFAD